MGLSGDQELGDSVYLWSKFLDREPKAIIRLSKEYRIQKNSNQEVRQDCRISIPLGRAMHGCLGAYCEVVAFPG